MTIHLLAALALAQAQPGPIASDADVACVTAPIAAADHEPLLDEILGGREETPVRARMVAAAEACARDGSWTDERRRQAGRVAVLSLLAAAARGRLARTGFDAARIDRWLARQSTAGPLPPEISREQGDAVATAMEAEGAAIRDERRETWSASTCRRSFFSHATGPA